MWARYNRTLEPEYVFKDVIGIGYDEQDYWEEFQVTSKISYLTLSHFVIENFFKTLLAEIDTTKNPPSGFYKLSKALLEKITISDKDRKLEILNTMAMIRNSMHNNGIHVPLPPAPDSQTITIGSTSFQFVKGQQTSIKESHMIDLINGVVDVLEEILNSQEVTRLPSVPLLYVPKHR